MFHIAGIPCTCMPHTMSSLVPSIVNIIEIHHNNIIINAGILYTYIYWGTHVFYYIRFGKILWRNVPEDMLQCSWGVDKFADLCFSDTKHSRIFTTEYVLV